MKAKFLVGQAVVTARVPDGRHFHELDEIIIERGDEEWTATAEQVVESYVPISKGGEHFLKQLEKTL